MKVTSKLNNAKILLKNKHTASHIPETRPLTQPNLSNMLDDYPFVYLKPNDSAQGKGILRVDKNTDHFLIRSRDTKEATKQYHFTDLVDTIKEWMRNRTYIIQQGIKSTTLQEKPFDIRTHLGRISGKWQIGGIVARIAESGSIVTNTYSGGISKYVHATLLEDLQLSPLHALKIIQRMKFISLEATKSMSKIFPKWCEYGLDIGLDQNLFPWIYEINIAPGGKVFENLDQKSYRHILKLHKNAS